MAGFGQNPTTTTQGTLSNNQFPISSVAVPGKANGDLTALKGGVETTDANNNKLAGAAMYIYDGEDVAGGATTDTAVIGDNPGTRSAKLRGLNKLFADVWDSVNHWLQVKVMNTVPVSGTVTANVTFPGTQPVSGIVTANVTFPTEQGVNVNQVNGTALSTANPVPTQTVSQSGYVALTSPPTATNAGSDTALTFSSQVNEVIIQNNTSANAYYAFDTAASAGSLVLVPGSTLIYPKKVTVLHLYTVAAQNINGTAVGGIVVLGEL